MRTPYSQEVLACRAKNISSRIARKSFAIQAIAEVIERDRLEGDEDPDHKPLGTSIMAGLAAALLDIGETLYEESEGLREVDYETTD